MSYTIPNLATFAAQFLGKAIGTGQCVSLCESAIPAMPHTAGWKSGRKVQGDLTVPCGTVIATFGPAGTYQNLTDGSSHAAIYVGQSVEGLWVFDQWVGQVCHMRVIRFKAPGDGLNVNNGVMFSVVEPVDG